MESTSVCGICLSGTCESATSRRFHNLFQHGEDQEQMKERSRIERKWKRQRNGTSRSVIKVRTNEDFFHSIPTSLDRSFQSCQFSTTAPIISIRAFDPITFLLYGDGLEDRILPALRREQRTLSPKRRVDTIRSERENCGIDQPEVFLSHRKLAHRRESPKTRDPWR